MTECAETIILPPTVPSSQPKKEHPSLNEISYVGVTLHPHSNAIEELQTENENCSAREDFRSTNPNSDLCVLDGKNAPTHAFPQESTSSCSQRTDNQFHFMNSCTMNQLPLSSSLCLTPPQRQHCGPQNSHASSALYTTLISSKEMAAHEASNFKDVKGVYKNCRGIWAAQWTDERGQRHTKYFNPKYYSTEAEARREAFKFKVYIAREIELKGGVQKRRSCAAVTAISNTMHLNDCLLQQSYVQDRSRRVYRGKISKAVGLRNMLERAEIDKNGLNMNMSFYNTPYMNNGQYDPGSPGSSPSGPGFVGGLQGLLYHDYIMMPQQQQQHPPHQAYAQFALQRNSSMMKASGMQAPLPTGHYLQTPRRPFNYNMERMDNVDLSLGNLVSNAPDMNQGIPGPNISSRDKPLYASSGGLMYTSSSFDPLYFSPNPTSVGTTDPNAGFPFCVPQNVTSSPLHRFSENANGVGSSVTASPPQNTKLCACGCGILALAPSRYAAHHHGLLTQMNPNSRFANVVVQNVRPYNSSLTLSTPSNPNFSENNQSKKANVLANMATINGAQDTPSAHDSETSSSHQKITKPPVFPVLVDCEPNTVTRDCGEYEALINNNYSRAGSPSANPFYALHSCVLNNGCTRSHGELQDSKTSQLIATSCKRLKQDNSGFNKMERPTDSLSSLSTSSPHSQEVKQSRYQDSTRLSQGGSELDSNKQSKHQTVWPMTSPMENQCFPLMNSQIDERAVSRSEASVHPTADSEGQPCPSHSVDSTASFPFSMSWSKCFPLYASYPTEDFNPSTLSGSHPETTFSNITKVLAGVGCSANETTVSQLHETSSGSTDVDVGDIFNVTNVVSLSFVTPPSSDKKEALTSNKDQLSMEKKSSTLNTPPVVSSSSESELLKNGEQENASHFLYPSYVSNENSSSVPLIQLGNNSSLSSPLHPMY